MSSHAELTRTHLAKGPSSPRQLIDLLRISQPTLSRVLTEIGESVVRIGAARSIQYALRDEQRGLPDFDMTPMGFRPTSGGALQDSLTNASLQADVPNGVWRQAQVLAKDFSERVKAAPGFSARFAPCIAALSAHLETAAEKIRRLA
jgi:hypothetical protein